jgi:glucuronate isomerase
MPERSPLSPDRFFSAEPSQRKIARQLYDSVMNLPLVSPCMRLNPGIFTDQIVSPPDPCDLLIFSNKYILNRFLSQGIDLHNGSQKSKKEPHQADDSRKIWQAFVEKSYLLRGIPADILLSEILYSVFGIKEKLAPKNAVRIYDTLVDNLKQADFQPFKLLERFNIETLGVLDSPANPLLNITNPHWMGKIIPCFDADELFNIQSSGWSVRIQQLGEACQSPITTASNFIRAIQKQRLHFKSRGATTFTQSFSGGDGNQCTPREIELVFQRATRQEASAEDACQFSNYMLYEMAAMSVEDNLVFQLSQNRSNQPELETPSNDGFISERPIGANLAGLKRLIEHFGQDKRLSIIFIPQVTQFFSEAGINFDRFPNLKIGTPDWFFNGLGSMQQYFGLWVENFGVYKTAGLDTSPGSLLALPSQHDIWRRTSANWLANLVVTGLVDIESAYEIIYALAYSLAKSAYHFK